MSLNQFAYTTRYNKENYKMYPFRIKRSDTEIIEKLDSITNRNAYIVGLIKENIDSKVLTLKTIKEKIKPIMNKHNIKEVYLFGSYARGEANSNSDVDIYCDSGDLKSLYDEVDFKEELENALNKKVDVVTIGSSMHPYFKKQLEEALIKLFNAKWCFIWLFDCCI